MKALIFGNAEIKSDDWVHSLISEDCYIICCDGGIRHLFRLGLTPDIIIGDLDSAEEAHISYYQNKSVPFQVYPAAKDQTDMELCMAYALSLNPDEIFIFGGMGSRFDHSLANANLLWVAREKNVTAWLMQESNQMTLIDNHTSLALTGVPGDIISLIPYSEVTTGVTTSGLAYPLAEATLYRYASRGVSNVMQGETARVTVASGALFVIRSRD